MSEIAEKFNVLCRACGAEATVTLDDNGGCNDPECCGGASYYITVTCPQCEATADQR